MKAWQRNRYLLADEDCLGVFHYEFRDMNELPIFSVKLSDDDVLTRLRVTKTVNHAINKMLKGL